MLLDFLTITPHHSAALNLLATIRAKEGRLNEAKTLLQKAISLDPEATALRDNLTALQKAIAKKKTTQETNPQSLSKPDP